MMLLHSLRLLEAPGITVLPVLAWAAAVRLLWRRGKAPLDP